ncbi:MAG: monovalent cation/H(+) antiporter subunit G [Planctomycetes bacterium]|nr:monovalent cation/H(+) antiporter subunit G [Planctomycetota bacterium]
MTAMEMIGTGLFATGLFFQLVASVGLVRFPDLYCRLHVVGVTDTLGGPLVLLGAAFHLGFSLTAFKLLLAIGFLYLTCPLVGHMLARAAMEAGHAPWAPPKVKS